MFEVRDFRILDEVLRTGSLSGAARALGMSQPAVSQAVSALERRVGTTLLRRTATGVSLTEAGRSAAGHIRPVLAAVRQAEVELATVVGLSTGAVRIACFPSAAATLVPRALGALRRSDPTTRFSMIDLEPPEAVARLAADGCDIAVVFEYADDPQPYRTSEGTRTVLCTEQMFAVLPAAHPLAAAEAIPLASLDSAQWIAGCPSCRSHLLRLCDRAGFTPEITFQTDDHLVMLRCVAEGLGVAVVPEVMLTVAEVAGVVARPVEPSTTRTISALRSTRSLSSDTVTRTVSALVAAGARALPAN